MKKMVFTSREITILKQALLHEASQDGAPVEEITDLLEKLDSEPEKHYHLDWHGNLREI